MTSISPFVSNLDRPVFALRNLPEEVVAVLFAYYSRSADPLRENLRRLLEEGDVELTGSVEPADEDTLLNAREKARQFHEKWVVGYGHGSVAEHAVVHLALEDVSILASKVIEDARLASFTEKSTRYVVFDESRYHTPAEFSQSLDEPPSSVLRLLLGTYARLMPQVIAQVERRTPKREGQTERAWKAVCRSSACDVLRYLLPTATHTNLGITANARTLEHLITKMLSHPLAECRSLGAQIKDEARKIVPTLIKYADRSDYLAESPGILSEYAGVLPQLTPANGPDVRLIRAPIEPEIDLATALLYDRGTLDWATLRQAVAGWPREKVEGVIRSALARKPEGMRGDHDQALRHLEHLTYTYEITIDYGAFRDIHRHRMATQTRQRLTPDLGYSTPPEIEEFGLLDEYRTCMDAAASAFRELEKISPDAAPYVLPLAYRMRVLFTWNLREMDHFITLRSSKQGHASYRRIAQDVWKALSAESPLMAEFIRVDMNDYRLARDI